MNMIAPSLGKAARAAWLVAAIVSSAHATERPGAAPTAPKELPSYTDQRIRSFMASPSDGGMRNTRIDLRRLDACIAAIRLHAGNRPVRFNTAEEESRARRDAIQLGVLLAEITQHEPASPRMLLRTAITLSLADNLGAPGAELAEARFAKLLEKTPDNAEALYEFGVFLANRGRPSDALAPLQRALAGGDERARWPLAVSLIALDRTAEAQAELEALQAKSAGAARDYPVAETLAALRAVPAARP